MRLAESSPHLYNVPASTTVSSARLSQMQWYDGWKYIRTGLSKSRRAATADSVLEFGLDLDSILDSIQRVEVLAICSSRGLGTEEVASGTQRGKEIVEDDVLVGVVQGLKRAG